MPRIAYKEQKFSAGSLKIIQQANEIIAGYLAQGYKLTLRQLYYQFVARGLIANKQTEYKRLGSIVNDARLAGLIDWDAIEDRGREVQLINAWSDPEELIRACANQYKIDLWADQPNYVEVYVEKEALLGVIEPVCRRLRVTHFACKGYTSQSTLWDSGCNRLKRQLDEGKRVVILHLGDHDPSGIDMTRDIGERLSLFAEEEIEVRRIALNMDQIQHYAPPPNPAKPTDARYTGYQALYGEECWELDALEPGVIDALIEEHVLGLRDDKLYKQMERREREERAVIRQIADRFDEVRDWLENEDDA